MQTTSTHTQLRVLNKQLNPLKIVLNNKIQKEKKPLKLEDYLKSNIKFSKNFLDYFEMKYSLILIIRQVFTLVYIERLVKCLKKTNLLFYSN